MAHRETITVVAEGMPVNLTHPPLAGTVTLVDSANEAVDNSVINYIDGTVTLDADDYPDGARATAVYRYDAADSIVERAIRDLGTRLPQRIYTTVEVGTGGEGDLPQGFQSLLKAKDITEYENGIWGCECVAAVDGFDCATFRLYISGGKFYANPGPAQELTIAIYYLGGFFVETNGEIVGLTRELADIAMLKAVSLSLSSSLLNEIGSATSISREPELIEHTYGLPDERATDRWESGHKIMESKTKGFAGISNVYEQEYERRINSIAGITRLSRNRTGYRARIG